jgi:branched-chain amino acid transport system permease protein
VTSGLLAYLIGVLTLGGIYAVLALGLNLHWGFTGLLNAGIAGFVAVGGYAAAILTSGPATTHIGGFDLPILAAMLVAMALCGAIALGIGMLTLNLRGDYLAMATLGIAEIIRLIARNEAWLTAGPHGISGVPRPFEQLDQPWAPLGFLGVVIAAVGCVYWASERAARAPWGRVQRAIRENELAAAAAGKNVRNFRLQSFVVGAMVMGLGGALLTHYLKFVSPETSDPTMVTFLVWVMLIAGGSGNNRGAILGGFGIWALWSLTDLLTGQLGESWGPRAAYLRIFLIGLALQLILIFRPQGLIGERPPRPPEA